MSENMIFEQKYLFMHHTWLALILAKFLPWVQSTRTNNVMVIYQFSVNVISTINNIKRLEMIIMHMVA